MREMQLVVLGAAGRMGRLLLRAVIEDPSCRLASAVVRPNATLLGEDAGTLAGLPPAHVALTADLEAALDGADGVLDFTTPDVTAKAAPLVAARGLVHVVGTTGLGPPDYHALRLAARSGRVVQSGNTSLGVNVLAGLVREAAARLGAGWDIEIVEMHHRMKVDAPSGTALLLGEAAAEGRGIALSERSVRARDGHAGVRRDGDIGFACLRGGTVVGDHVVVIAGRGERIELAHRAEDRGLFARGAVRAALWARDQEPGCYGMADVLGLRSG